MDRTTRISNELSQLSKERSLLLEKRILNEDDEAKLIQINTVINQLQKELFHL